MCLAPPMSARKPMASASSAHLETGSGPRRHWCSTKSEPGATASGREGGAPPQRDTGERERAAARAHVGGRLSEWGADLVLLGAHADEEWSEACGLNSPAEWLGEGVARVRFFMGFWGYVITQRGARRALHTLWGSASEPRPLEADVGRVSGGGFGGGKRWTLNDPSGMTLNYPSGTTW